MIGALELLLDVLGAFVNNKAFKSFLLAINYQKQTIF